MDVEQCKTCGCKEYIMKQKVSGFVYFRSRFDGDDADNTELHDDITYSNVWKFPRCENCGKRIM